MDEASSSLPGPRPTNETALLILVPEAEPLVDHWRQRFDPSALVGVPAHITVLSPFLDADELVPETIAELRALFAGHDAFDVQFHGFGQFPGLLYLDPEPAEPIRALTEAVVARWPERQPYGGAYEGITPHLTICYELTPQLAVEIVGDVDAGLPVTSRVAEVHLLMSDGEQWGRRESFALGG